MVMSMGFLKRMHVVVQLQFIMIFILLAAAAASAQPAEPADHHCDRQCGGVDIPFPFGTTKSCALGDKFLINCDKGSDKTILGDDNLVVEHISIENHEIIIISDVARICYKEGMQYGSRTLQLLRVPNFTISSTKNKFYVIGCDSYAYLYGNLWNVYHSTGCLTRCISLETESADGSCSGFGCCNIDIPHGLKNISVEPYSFHNYANFSSDMKLNPCTYAFVVEQDKFSFSRDYLRKGFHSDKLPIVLEWTIDSNTCNSTDDQKNNNAVLTQTQRKQPFCPCGDNTTTTTTYLDERSGSYYCKCKAGYIGNPYTPQGCQDDNECLSQQNNCTAKGQECVNLPGSYTCKSKDQQLAIEVIVGVAVGILALLLSSSWLYLVFKRRKLIKLKEKFFRQNGGFILKQKLSPEEEYSNEAAKIFTEEELKKATLNYDASTVIGRGGFGTVYKGFLQDNKIVAIKKSKTVDQIQTEQFINEVIVLSRINHRNVVKLLGCCLETEVPLLVYEFVPNGTLFEHIHDESKASNLPWEVRLGIAAETAGALSYLHSAASTPIIHRVVKSSNILLDNYTAKVSDFGASRLVPLDQIEVATMVQGTLGYLDPEYLRTNQLTEKSDVYSFGVVLVELLTGRKALLFDRPEDERNLAQYFLHSSKEGRLFEVIEGNINNEENKEQIKEVAELAKRCLNLKGDDRPSMKEVAMELEGLGKTEKHPWVNDEEVMNMEEIEYLLAETSNANDGSITNSAYDSVRDHVALDFSGR